MHPPLYIVNAFATRSGAGNPAGVCLLPGPDWPAATWMRQVAAELKHSETAFVLPPAVGVDAAQPIRPIRYFTPEIEVELCGHATLASAHAMWRHESVAAEQAVRFRTIADEVLTCTLDADGLIAMDLPASAPQPADAPAALNEIFDPPLTDVCRAGFQWLGVWPDAAAVRDWVPDHAALAAVGWAETHGIVLTAPGGQLPDGRPADFTSRFFAPGAGIAEDPVTGSAHAMLGPFWAERLGKTKMLAHQASPRGGTLAVEVRAERVVVSGQAVTAVAGQWVAPRP